MFVFKKNMIYINKLSPTVKLPFKEVKGSVNYRQSKACNMVDKLYREILPQFNKKEENRFLYLLDKGYKMIKLINTSIKPSDKLPADGVIKQIVDDGIKYINQGGNAYIINLENFEITYK